HHQPQAQHPNFQLSTSWSADYPIFRGQIGKHLLVPSLPLLNPQLTTEVEATSILPLLEREDCTPMAWYPSLRAPRAGGAYDSHHRTAGVAGCARRGGGRVAVGFAGAAAADAGDRHPRSRFT